MYKNIIINYVRVIVAVILVYFVLKQVHWNDYIEIDKHGNEILYLGIYTSIQNIKLKYLLLAILCTIIAKIVIGIRWYVLLKLKISNIKIKEVIKLTFLADFISLLLPGFVGGDLVKGYIVSKLVSNKIFIYVSIFIDRISGFIGYFIVAILMLLIIIHSKLLTVEQLSIPILTIKIILGCLIGGTCIVIICKYFDISILDKLFKKLPLSTYLNDIIDIIFLIRKKYTLVKLLGFTSFAQLLSILSVMLIGLGLSLKIPWYAYFLYVPLITIISSIPITPGGIGLMEELYILFFVSESSNSELLLLAIIVRFVILLSNLPGGLIAILDKKSFKLKYREIKNI